MKRRAKILSGVKKHMLTVLLCCTVAAEAQYLPVPLVAQQQDQWCWAGVSAATLAYYGKNYDQCNIAEYARTVATPCYDLGTTNCCTNANAGCNHSNYNWSCNGSIQDILQHLGSISNTGVGSALTVAQITAEVAANHLFIEHWAWATSGGHFVVGHGISGAGADPNIYYMNPWPGEGYHICDYNWMLHGTVAGMGNGDHTWDGTNKITYYPPVNGIPQVQNAAPDDLLYPNPSTGVVFIKNRMNDELTVYNTTGRLMYHETLLSPDAKADLSVLPKGMYIVRLSSPDNATVTKLVLE